MGILNNKKATLDFARKRVYIKQTNKKNLLGRRFCRQMKPRFNPTEHALHLLKTKLKAENPRQAATKGS